jgi:lysophospholipase L1-like esterase
MRGLLYGFRKWLADGTPQHAYVGPCGKAPYQHAGVGGTTTIDWMASGSVGKQLPGWLRAANPQRVYLMVGTNDVIAARSNPPAIDLSVERMATLVGALAKTYPSISFVVGCIPNFEGSPSSDLNQLVHNYNAGLKSAIPALGLGNVRVIDAMGLYNTTVTSGKPVSADGTHPNDAGYLLMAKGLLPFFGGDAASVKTPDGGSMTDDGAKVVPEPANAMLNGPMQWTMGPRHEVVTRDRGGAGEPEVLIYAPTEAAAFHRRVVVPWLASAQRASKKWGVPVSFILATIEAESGGDPRAKGPPNGIGLMQLDAAAAKQGHSDEELMDDPDLNIDLGARVFAMNIKRYGLDLPHLSSAYNCGTALPRPGTLWGLCAAAQAYLTRVVLANNTYLLKEAGVSTSPKSGSWVSGALLALGAVVAVVAIPWGKVVHRGGR